jgi:glutaredoxin
MAGQLYRVVFEGEILEGSQVQEVKRALAKLYNKREDQVEHYFSGKRLTVKKDVDYETAMKYVKAYERAGAVCRVEELETHAGLEQPLMLEKETEKPSQQDGVMVCPKCQFEQAPSEECIRCGIIISKYTESLNAPEMERRQESIRVEPQQSSFKFLTISVALLVVVLASGFYYFSGTPRYSLSENRTSPKVELYTTSWCPYCEKARDFFRSRGISFTEYDIEKDKNAAARKNKLDKKNGVPFVMINGRGYHGWSAAGYEQAYEQALKGHP